MSKKPILALDTDSVILNFEDPFYQALCQYTKRQVPILNDHFTLESRYGVSRDIINEVFNFMAEQKYFSRLPPLPKSLLAIDLLESQGYELHVVTAINPDFIKQREANFEALGFKPKQIHCVGFGNSKEHVVAEIGAIALFDDRLSHLKECAPHMQYTVQIDDGFNNLNEEQLLQFKPDVKLPSLFDGALWFLKQHELHQKKTQDSPLDEATPLTQSRKVKI